MNIFFKKNLFIILPVLIFSLFASFYVVFAQTTVSGVCNIRNNSTNAPTFYLPDFGTGYAKKTQPGINTISELRAVCTREVYEELLRQYCKQNSKPASPEVITYGKGGRLQSVGGSAFGSEPMKCPVSPAPTKSPIPKALSAITYPVADLGSCTSYEDCKTYCSVSSNYSQCAAFAQKNNLTAEIPDDKKAVFAAMQKGEGPGGCGDEASCRNYCEDVDHLGECVDFVEKFKLASGDELKEMRQIADVKKAGVAFPGNCKTKESCLKYCDNSANAVVCMEFALKAGFIPKEDAEAVGKILPYLKSGGKLPSGCVTKKSCDTYCANDTNINECVDFAAGVGFMTKEEADIVKKTGGKGPGNCRSREACDSYCKDESHIDECMDFAVKAGLISKEESEMVKKLGITSGPGGCKGKAECESFCALPQNQNTCFEFAKEHGLTDREDAGDFGQQPDFTECLARATCEEFFSCLNPSGRQTSQQGGPEQESPPELKERMDSCQDELKETKKKEVQEKFDACFTLSCSEYEACMKSIEQSGDQQDGQQQAQGTPDPKIKAKAEACQKEKINACLSKPCGEFQSCINSLGGGGGGDGPSDPAVGAKFQSCQPKDEGGGAPPSNGTTPPGGSSSEIPITPELCANFAQTPSCSYVGSPDSENYKLCAECFPAKTQQFPYKSPDPSPFSFRNHSFLGAISRFLFR